jgi:hypothetical protein
MDEKPNPVFGCGIALLHIAQPQAPSRGQAQERGAMQAAESIKLLRNQQKEPRALHRLEPCSEPLSHAVTAD